MGKITVEIDDTIDRQLRHAVLEKFGTKKGALAKAVEEALRLWLKEQK